MERKLKNADDVYHIKAQVCPKDFVNEISWWKRAAFFSQLKDKERQADLQDRINRNVARENAILSEDLAEKERQILQLQSEVDNLDRVIAAKVSLLANCLNVPHFPLLWIILWRMHFEKKRPLNS